MTEEEKAKEMCKGCIYEDDHINCDCPSEYVYLAGFVEGRNEREEQIQTDIKWIDNLEKENAELIDKLNLQNQRLNELKKENEEIMNALEKTMPLKLANQLKNENAELKKEIDQLSNDNHVLKTSFITQQEQIENLEEDKEQIIFESDLKIKALEEMIEKMKRCENCKHCGLFFDRDEEQFYCCKFYNDCLKYNKWESAE